MQDRPASRWTELYWSDVPAEESEQRLATIRERDWKEGFDFEAGPPLRFLPIRHSERLHTLVWTYHHVLLDGRSALDVWRESFGAPVEAIL